MTQLHVESTARIPAPPEQVYAVLADYRNGHPNILPKEYFPSLIVEEGGHGAGTVMRVKTRFMGMERDYHLIVSEPEPGRRLVETDMDTGLVTTFTVEPAGDGRESYLTIATDWKAGSGLAGWLERLTTPGAMRKIYARELQQVAEFMQRQGASAQLENR